MAEPDESTIVLNTLKAMLSQPVGVVMNMHAITRYAVMAALVIGVIVVFLALARRVGHGRRSGLLSGLGLAGLLIGFLGALYTGGLEYVAAQKYPVAHFHIVLPGIVEAGFSLILGLVVWGIAGFGNSGAKRS